MASERARPRAPPFIDPPGYMDVIDALARDVGVRGIFSDWPATVSFYAGCAGLP